MNEDETPTAPTTSKSTPLVHEVASTLICTLASLLAGRFTKQAYDKFVVNRETAVPVTTEDQK